MSKQRTRTRSRRVRAVYAVTVVTALFGAWWGTGPKPAEASHGFCEPVIYAFDPFCFDPFPNDPFDPFYDPFYDPFCCFEPYIPYIPPDFIPPPTTTDRPPRPIVPNNT